MHLSIEVYFLEHFASIGFETAVEIVQGQFGEIPEDRIKDQRWPAFVPWVVPPLLPSTDDVISLFYFLKHSGDFFWIVLQVRIHGDHDLPGGFFKTRTKRCGLSKIPSETDPPDVVAFLAYLFNGLPRPIG